MKRLWIALELWWANYCLRALREARRQREELAIDPHRRREDQRQAHKDIPVIDRRIREGETWQRDLHVS